MSSMKISNVSLVNFKKTGLKFLFLFRRDLENFPIIQI